MLLLLRPAGISSSLLLQNSTAEVDPGVLVEAQAAAAEDLAGAEADLVVEAGHLTASPAEIAADTPRAGAAAGAPAVGHAVGHHVAAAATEEADAAGGAAAAAAVVHDGTGGTAGHPHC